MPIRSLPVSAPVTPHGSRRGPVRAHATRAAVVATTSAAAALLAVLPVGAPAPVPAAAAPVAAAPADRAPVALGARAAALPVVTLPAVTAPVVTAPVEPVARQAMVATPAAAPAAAGRSSVVELALSKVGSPYRWGGTGPSSFDCSGLVNWAFDQVGVDVPRTSRALSRAGEAVSRDSLRPGDLVFFSSPVSHVGIYIGDGRMVHASTSGKPVAVADIDGRPYHSARRI